MAATIAALGRVVDPATAIFIVYVLTNLILLVLGALIIRCKIEDDGDLPF
jgi:hypothetical protein